MIFEKFERIPDGTILRHREVQTELAEWVQAGPGVWGRKVRTW